MAESKPLPSSKRYSRDAAAISGIHGGTLDSLYRYMYVGKLGYLLDLLLISLRYLDCHVRKRPSGFLPCHPGSNNPQYFLPKASTDLS